VRLFRTGSPGIDYFTGIVGSALCRRRPAHALRAPGERRHRRLGGNRELSPDRPRPDFLYKLAALNYASPVPPGTPTRDMGMRRIPGTGPYRIARSNRREIRFARNPYFREWSHAAHPTG